MRRPEFNPGGVRVRFVAKKVALGEKLSSRYFCFMRFGISCLIQRLATSWTVWGSNTGKETGFLFSTPTQTGTEAYLTSVPGVKRPGCGVDHPLPSSTKVKNE